MISDTPAKPSTSNQLSGVLSNTGFQLGAQTGYFDHRGEVAWAHLVPARKAIHYSYRFIELYTFEDERSSKSDADWKARQPYTANHGRNAGLSPLSSI